MFSVEVHDFDDWRIQARELLKRGISPDKIAWQSQGQTAFVFKNEQSSFLKLPALYQEISIPKSFFGIAQNVACFRDESRWPLLYSIAWRLVFENRELLSMAIDPEVKRVLSMNKKIGRDKHKMEAFVRFKRIQYYEVDSSSEAEKSETKTYEHFVAWFEPEHLILPLKMPFFVKRFHNMKWSILTPDICAHWDQRELTYSKGLSKAPKIEDDLEVLWLEYYKSTFNPARLKLKAMQSEMPKKYWINLPEARLIKSLTRGSMTEVENMIAKGHSAPWNKTEKSRFIKDKQQLRRTNK